MLFGTREQFCVAREGCAAMRSDERDGGVLGGNVQVKGKSRRLGYKGGNDMACVHCTVGEISDAAELRGRGPTCPESALPGPEGRHLLRLRLNSPKHAFTTTGSPPRAHHHRLTTTGSPLKYQGGYQVQHLDRHVSALYICHNGRVLPPRGALTDYWNLILMGVFIV
ncbi:hypothetical protein E6O75_ATG01514 [Venturia nashicola]|uniref:Uncharacterized protein n=1 Tax=Venturia nashicola TaxID=86259 RepID=A0A4Z1PMA8_9PEZI|nr:hypothetical protein E6O75_ATG01514 [Venturia nashicola]